ncbi:MAG: hypothetical protein CMN76_03295 [Spirochaetaceae bacterium]|nr:hypothetical protein [Spirochaetaceae bacterium]
MKNRSDRGQRFSRAIKPPTVRISLRSPQEVTWQIPWRGCLPLGLQIRLRTLANRKVRGFFSFSAGGFFISRG